MSTLSLGTVVNKRYRIVRDVGHGGFGAVYEAMDERLGRHVALKRLLLGGEQISRQFEREARLLANLNHPALPRVSDHFSDADGQFLVMDFIPGKDLGYLLMDQDTAFSVSQVLAWGAQLLDALHYLHTCQPKILHRDIKPQNLKLHPDGRIMLLDFGLAKGWAGGNTGPLRPTDVSIMAYTKGFAPPEQIDGVGTDERSDLYSLAGTLYCLLTGIVPDDPQRRKPYLDNGRPDPLRPAHELNPAVPEAVSRVLTQALSLDPAQRPASAAAMRAMLAAAGGPAVAQGPAAAPAPRTEVMQSMMLSELLGIPSDQPQPTPQPTAYASAPQPAPHGPVSQPAPHGPVPQPTAFGASPQAVPYAPPPQPTTYGAGATAAFAPAPQPAAYGAGATAAFAPAPPLPRAPRRLPRLSPQQAVGAGAVGLVALLALVLLPLMRVGLPPFRSEPTAGPEPTPAPLTAAQVEEKLRPSTVMISANFPPSVVDPGGEGGGTGIVLDDKGHIVTNAHVVQGASSLTVALSGGDKPRPARIVGVSTCDDLAILQVKDTEGLVPATFGSSADVQLGDPIVVLGYPMRFDINNDIAVTLGAVSRLDVTSGHYASLMQIDASVNHGNSGGPLTDMYGRVIGINSLGYSGAYASNVAFAISIDHAQKVIAELKGGQNLGWLGMNLVFNDYADYFGTEDGLVVAATDPRGPASAIGVKAADLLLSLAGSPIASLDNACQVLQSSANGSVLELVVGRVEGGALELYRGSIIVGEYRPNEPQLERVETAPRRETAPQGEPEAEIDQYNYDFSSDIGAWTTGSGGGVTAKLSDGLYILSLDAGASHFVSPALAVPAAPHMGVGADVAVVGAGRAGLAVRYSSRGGAESYYAFWISSTGEYGAFVSVDGRWTTMIEPTRSSAIRPDAVNRISMIAAGSTVVIQINGQKVAEIPARELDGGVPALFLANMGAGATAAFDNVTIRTTAR